MTKKVVTLTTLPALYDGRTKKIATSFARWGYDSILIDNSVNDNHSYPFRLISLGEAPISPSMLEKVKTNIKKTAYSFAINRIPRQLQSLLAQFRGNDYSSWYMSFYRDRVLKVLPEADLYVIRSYLQYPAIEGKRIIYDAGDFYQALWTNPNEYEKKIIMPFHHKVEEGCMRNAIAVTTVCDGLVSLIKNAWGRNPHVIMNCHDTRLDISHEPPIKKMLKLTPSDYLVVVVGTAKGGMAIGKAREALDRLPQNVHIAFVGPDHKDYGKRMHSVGYIPTNEIVPFIRDADCSMIIYWAQNINYYHCLPNSIFHNIAARLPVLYSNLPDMSKLASGYNFGLPIDSLDSNSIADGIKEMMASRPSRFDMETAARELCWANEEQKLKKIVDTIFH